MFRGIFNSLRWRVRIALWGAAAVSGLAVVGFAKLAEMALGLFAMLTDGHGWIALFLTPFIGMASVWLTLRYFPGAQGSGIPQVIAATQLAARQKPVDHLVSWRIALGKVFVGSFALIGGFSAGREGPSVQVAASIMHLAHRLLPNTRLLRPSDLILAGGAAGVAAAFNTPLAGIVFAVEELGRRLETRTSGVLISTIVLSGLVSIALLGNYHYFGRLRVESVNVNFIIPILCSGIVSGLIGGTFSRLMLWPQMASQHPVWVWRRAHPVWFAGICGLLVALIGWADGGLSFGSGYAVTQKAVAGELVVPWYVIVTRYLTTSLSYFSGIPGGLFAPSLAIGGALGSTLSQVLAPHGGPTAIIALCMAGVLAAVTQSPITAAIIVMEMIDGHEMVISLMAVAFIAKAISNRISPELYQHLARAWLEPRQ